MVAGFLVSVTPASHSLLKAWRTGPQFIPWLRAKFSKDIDMNLERCICIVILVILAVFLIERLL